MKRTGKWMVDPPRGWMYGFPKKWDVDKEPDINKWMIKEGMPKEAVEEIEKYGLCYRLWRSDD